MKYKLAIFDLDGTILNTLDDLLDSCNEVCRLHGFPLHDMEEYRFFVGNGIPKMIERAIPKGTDEATYKQCLAEYIEYYAEHSAIKTRPYDGMVELLMALKNKGVLTAVNSNKVETAAVDLCDRYFPGLFDVVTGNIIGNPVKPDPFGVYRILEQVGMTKEEAASGGAVFIGDSDVDVLTGKNASLDVIGCDWGFRGEKFLREHGAETVVKTPAEILKYF